MKEECVQKISSLLKFVEKRKWEKKLNFLLAMYKKSAWIFLSGRILPLDHAILIS